MTDKLSISVRDNDDRQFMLRENVMIKCHCSVFCDDLKPGYCMSLLEQLIHNYYHDDAQNAILIET